MKQNTISTLLFLALFPLPALAADIDASADSLSFSQSDFFASEQIRIYGALSNRGNQDIRGVVEFFQGVNQIGEQRPFSVKAFGPAAYVWADWTPTEGTYNVSMKIMSTEPVDQNLSNNTAVSGLMTIAKRPPPPPPPAPTPAPSPLSAKASATAKVQPLLFPTEEPKTFPKVEPQTKKVVPVSASTDAKALMDKSKKMVAVKQDAPATPDKQKELAPIADELKNIIQESLIPAAQVEKTVEPLTATQETEDTSQKNSGKKMLYFLGILATLSLAGGSYFFYLSRKE